MSCVLIYSKNSLYRECLGKIINDYSEVNRVVSIDDVSRIKDVYISNNPKYMVVDFYSRNFESNILNEVLKYFHGSQVVMITTMENKHLNFYNSLYGIKYFISAEERTENILNDLESVFSNDNKKFDNGAVKGLLTTRECEILQLIATGKTSKEIAEMLCISKNTVDTHRNKMLQKLNIANSASLVHFAYKSGLL